MEKLDLYCPSCGAILRSQSDLKDLQPGIHHIACDYCDYQGLLKIDADDRVSLEDLEAQSYARARGAYRARSEYEARRASTRRRVVIGVILAFVVIGIIGMVVRQAQRITIDPFAFAYPTFRGISGNGQAEIILIQPDEVSDIDLDRVEYHLSKDHGLREGEVVVIGAESDDYDLERQKKHFIVEGLAMQLRDVTGLSEAAQETIHDLSRKSLKSSYSNLADAVTSVEYQPAGLYLISDGETSNLLSDVMAMRITFRDGSEATYYGRMEYRDIVVYDGDAPTVVYASDWSLNGPVQRVHSDTDTAVHTFIYASLEDAKADARQGLEGTYTELEY